METFAKRETAGGRLHYTTNLDVGDSMVIQVMALPEWGGPQYEVYDVHWVPRPDGSGNTSVVCSESVSEERVPRDGEAFAICSNVIMADGSILHTADRQPTYRLPIFHYTTRRANGAVELVNLFEVYESKQSVVQGTFQAKGMVGYLESDQWGDFTDAATGYGFQIDAVKGPSKQYGKVYNVSPCQKTGVDQRLIDGFRVVWEEWMAELIDPTPSLASVLERLGLSDTKPQVEARIRTALGRPAHGPAAPAAPSVRPTAAGAAPPPPPYPAPAHPTQGRAPMAPLPTGGL